MYRLSPETDLNALRGTTLTFLGFGQYQVQLVFSGDLHCSISIEGDYIVTPTHGDPITISEVVAGAAALMPLLGRDVARASVPAEGTVRVVFDDGSVIDVLDSSADYESYQVNLGDRLFIV